jgi:ketosteroid isomerase-like protein
MSQESVELVRQALDAWVKVDAGLAAPGRLHEFFAPGVIVDLGDAVVGVRRDEIRGIDEFIQWRASWIEPYDDWTYSVEKIVDAGANGVVAVFRQRGKLHGSASWIEMEYAIIYTVEGGLITRGKVYPAPKLAFEAAGLSE